MHAADVSYAAEKNIPDLEAPFIDTTPDDLKDGIPVGELGRDGGKTDALLMFAKKISTASTVRSTASSCFTWASSSPAQAPSPWPKP